VSEARTPEEDTIQPAAENDDGESEDEGTYDGPDPEEDPKGDGSDEDQGT
jgi:hypothetical protein